MSFILTIKVHAQAPKTSCSLSTEYDLKCSVAAPPERGKANKKLLEYLASRMNLKSFQVRLLRGATTTIKQVFVDSFLDKKEVLRHFL